MTRRTAAKSKADKSKERASGSGASGSDLPSPGSSASPSPRSRVGNYSLVDLPLHWDNNIVVRDRMRSGMDLLLRTSEQGKPECGHIEGSRDNLILNQDVIEPLARLMKDHDYQLPSIDRLIEAICAVYRTARCPRNLEHCYKQAWAVRRCLQTLKHFSYGKAPPED